LLAEQGYASVTTQEGVMEELVRGFGLVEGPVWDPERGLFFSDVHGGGVYRLKADESAEIVFPHRKGIGGMCLHKEGGLVVGGRNIAFKGFDDLDETHILLDRDPENDNVGYNDLTADASGRIYAGSLGSAVFDEGNVPKSGDLYLIDLDGSAQVVATDVRLTNGLAFSPDASTLYHADSRRQCVFRYSVRRDGTLGDRDVFITTEMGAPDGMAVSEDGAVWVALAGGSGVGVYESNGSHRETIMIPVPMCTSVCFGGDDLRDLYIVSGSDGSSGEREGGIYRYRSDVAGLPVHVARVTIH
tara:strand:- start:294 stop:1196 length:903 start_codon:yes stop_codon:yes gene_type:complete